jgi:hypothetical protein
MHEAVDVLEEAAATATAPSEVREAYIVTHKALASAIKVIARADDSSGIIGDACRRLLALHPRAAARAGVPAGRLVEWMMKFQFDGEVDYFELDPIAYAPALGEKGLAMYRARLDAARTQLGPEPDQRWSSPHSHEWFVLQWNAQRLAVLDRDVDAIIRTHARDRKVAAWFEDTARAFEEISEIDLAIEWAKRATDAVLPVYRCLVEQELTIAGARHYQVAARRLKTMRRLAASDHDKATEVDAFVADLREQHRRRPRLQHEFDRAGLP